MPSNRIIGIVNENVGIRMRESIKFPMDVEIDFTVGRKMAYPVRGILLNATDILDDDFVEDMVNECGMIPE